MSLTRRSVFQPRSPRRIVDWGLGPANSVTITSPGKQLWTTGTSPSQNLTVIRTRGMIEYALITANAAGSGFVGASGIYMMTEDAFAVGVTAALDPLLDSNSDMWLWHSFFQTHAITSTIADGVNAVAAYHRVEIDSKAMRKNFDPERVMVGVTGVLETGTASLNIHADSRQLFKT